MAMKNEEKKKEKPWLMESGEYELRVGWVKELDDHTGFSCRFDTVGADEGAESVFFLTFDLFGNRSSMWRTLLAQIICAANIRIPTNPEDLEGAQFVAEVEVREVAGRKHPYYDFKKLWRCGSC